MTGEATTLSRLPFGRRLALLVGLAYALAYLYSVQNIVVAPGRDLALGAPVPSAAVVADWSAKLWKPIAPFVWEPVVAIHLFRPVAIFLSPPNLLLALGLGTLVGLNVAVAVARARTLRGRQPRLRCELREAGAFEGRSR